MLRFSPRFIGLLIIAFCLSSCVIGRVYEGPKIAMERLKDIKPGVTTKEEIIRWFGPPQNYISPSVFNQILKELDIAKEPPLYYSFANILTYQYVQGNIRALILILFNYAEAKIKSDHLVIFLDDSDRVKYYGFHKGTEELQ